MTKKRPGFHDLFAQIPAVCWTALAADADAQGESVTRRLTILLAKHYRIPAAKIPLPRRMGRKPQAGSRGASEDHK